MFLIVTHGRWLNVRNCLGVVLMHPRSFVSHKRSTFVNKRSSKTYFGFAVSGSIQTEENTHYEWFSISWWIVSVSQVGDYRYVSERETHPFITKRCRFVFWMLIITACSELIKPPNSASPIIRHEKLRRGLEELWYWPLALLAVLSHIFLFMIAYRVH